jgi:hypothetical protein
MTDITNITASQRILAHLQEGRLVQGTWHRERDGRELACMLGAIAPHIDDASKCPSSVMPLWLARLVVPMFDGQDMAAAMTWAGRFGTQMAQWHRLDEAAWFRVWASFCSWCVADAQRSADSAAVYTNAAAAADYAAAAAAAAVYANADDVYAIAEAAADAAAHAAAIAAALAAAHAANAAAAAAAANAANAANAAKAANADAARQACWTRMATTLCDMIDAELAASAAKET